MLALCAQLLTRLPEIEIGEPQWLPNQFVHGIKRLPAYIPSLLYRTTSEGLPVPTPWIFDFDNHYYEAPDAFTRYADRSLVLQLPFHGECLTSTSLVTRVPRSRLR